MENLKPGLYVSRVDRFALGRGKMMQLPITTFDLRLVPMNSEVHPPLSGAAIHTIEHLGAAFLRDESAWRDRLVYFGPMGCRTGCWLILTGDLTPNMVVNPKARFTTVRELVVGMCWFIMRHTTEIPGATKQECGNYRDHNLLAARVAAHNYHNVLCQSPEELGYDPFIYPK